MPSIRLTPTEVRRRVWAQHREIREMVDSVERMLDEPEPEGRIRRAVAVLADILQLHMAFEEQHLFPALARSPRFGPAGVAALCLDHERQREELALLTRLFEEGEADSLTWKVRALGEWLRHDMEQEEREALEPSLFVDHHEGVFVACAR